MSFADGLMAASDSAVTMDSLPTNDINTNNANANTTTNSFTTDNQTESASSISLIVAQDSELAHLPRELLDNVASLLPTTDFNNLRLTCKLVENKLFPYWSNAFFKKKQFMITEFSLQTLVEISRHATLGPCITHLVFGLDHLRIIPGDFVRTLEDYQQCQIAADLQEALLDTGGVLQLLSTVFRNLRNLANIDIRDFNSNTRYRDYIRPGAATQRGVVTAWKSYGHSELPPWSRFLGRQHNARLTGQGSADFVNRVFKVLLTALSQSARPIRGLEVIIRNCVAITTSAFAIKPILDITTSRLPMVLSGLTKLHLDIDLNAICLSVPGSAYQHSSWDSLDPPKSAREACDPATTNLRSFLALTPNVTWLRLNSTHHAHGVASRFLSWLALDPAKPFGLLDVEPCWSDTNPKPVSLPLRRLDLGNMHLSSRIMAHIFKKFDRLDSLSFLAVSLQTEIVQHDDDDTNNGTEWARLLRKLPVLAPKVKRVSLRNLTENNGQIALHDDPIIFVPTLAGGTPRSAFELSDATTTSFKALADMTWSSNVWARVSQARHFSDSGGSSIQSGDDHSIDTESLDEDAEDAEDVDGDESSH